MAIGFERNRGAAVTTLSSIEDVKKVLTDPYVIESLNSIRRDLDAAKLAKAENRMFAATDSKKRADNVKSQLPGFIFQCSAFEVHNWTDKKGKNHGDAAWRHQKYGIMNGLFMVDIDHVENPKGIWADLLDKGILKEWQVHFAFITSSREGLKIVMTAKTEYGNLFGNQQKFSEMYGVKSDESCKDSSRLSFTPCMDDVLYISETLVTVENPEFAKQWQGKYSDGSADQQLFQKGTSSSSESQNGGTAAGDTSDKWAELRQKIIANEPVELDDEHKNKVYDGQKVVDIISSYLGGEQPSEGYRHETLLALASDLRYILDCDLDEVRYYLYRLPFVQDLVRIGRDVEKTIMSGFKYELNKYKPKRLQEAIKALKPKDVAENTPKYSSDSVIQKFTDYGQRVEKLFDYYPCLKEACHGFEVASYPAVLFSAAALYGTLATKCYYYFYHRPEEKRRLNYCIFVIADPASSKSSIGALYKTILKPIIAQDVVYNKTVNDFKKSRKDFDFKKKKDKDKAEIVTPTVKTRIHGSRTANGIFIEDMVNNVVEVEGEKMHIHLFTFDAELDNATAASRGGQWIDKSVFELKAFHNEEDDQHYRNLDSITGPFDVYWNFIYTGTPFSLNKKVTERNFGSGLSTRLAVIPLASEKFKMMPLSKRSKQNVAIEELLTSWAYKLDEAQGELPLWPLVEFVWHWVDEMMKTAEWTNNEVMSLLCKRVPYYGINVTAPFILMRHWDEWTEKKTFKIDKIDKDFCNLVMEIQYYSQNIYFGAYAKHYFEERSIDVEKKSPFKVSDSFAKLLGKLPKQFKREEAEKAWNFSTTHTCAILNRMAADGFVKKNGKGKTTKYTKKD